MTHSVLLIGAGNIAQGFDNPEDSNVRTHLKAYKKFSNFFEVNGICDINKKLVDQVALKWEIRDVFYNFNQIKDFTYDVVSICSPDNTHGYFLKKVLLNKPKVIFLEKPMGLDYKESKIIFDECENNNILLLLNYSRLYIKDFSKIKSKLNTPDNKLLSIDLKYHKGFNHTCSHLINLLFFMFSPKLIDYKINDKIIDFDVQDPTISGTFNLKIDNNEFRLNIQGYNQSELNIIEMDIMSSNLRINYIESKGSLITEYEILEYDAGIKLKEYIKTKSYEIDYNNSFINSMGIIIQFLNKEKINNINDIKKSFLNTIKFINTIEKNE